ncbi:MAG: hypothetical protein ACR2HF_13085 [Methylococcaceae bacterium]
MKKIQTATLLLGVSLLSACTTGIKPDNRLPHPEAVRQILFRMDPEDWSRDISRNLQSWNYPVASETQELDASPTHILSAAVGRVEQSSTPAGLSFSMGSSDPRAPDFQKATVVPVVCTLRSADKPDESAALTMRFTSNPDRPDSRAALINHISTACYNLLSDLRIPRKSKTGTPSTTVPSWMPEVRIEIKEQPKTSPQRTPATLPDPAPVDEPASPASLQTEQTSPEGRKQMIIHNQGTPVILEFGYDRK